MQLFPRLALGTAVAAAALAGTGSASAALNATLSVGTASPGLASVRISAAYALSDTPIARVQFYVPDGYGIDTSLAPRTAVGTAEAGVYVTDVVGQETMPGTVSVANSQPTEGQKVPSCDPGAHLATWVIDVTGASHGWSIPLYVDKTTGAEAQLGATKLVICVPPPDVATSDQVRALNGNRLLSLTLSLTRLKNPAAAGEVRWHALSTPFVPGSNRPNDAASVETQAVLPLPQRLTLTASGSTLRGTLTAAGKPLAGAVVQIEVSKTKKRLSPFAKVRTNAGGGFSVRSTARGVRWFRASVTTPVTALGGSACTASFGASVPCVGAWSGGSRLLTGLVRVKR